MNDYVVVDTIETNKQVKSPSFLEAHSFAVSYFLTSLKSYWYVSFMVNVKDQKSISKEFTIHSNKASSIALTASIAGAFALAAGVFLSALDLKKLMQKDKLTETEIARKKACVSEIVATLALYGAYFLNVFKQKEVSQLFLLADAAMVVSLSSGIFITGNAFFMATSNKEEGSYRNTIS